MTTPTFVTNATVPLVIGGTATTSTLTLQSTSGVGTTLSDIIFKDDNTEFMRILNSGNVGIGTTAPLSKLGITGNLSVGSTFGAIAAPTSGAIIEGITSIGASSPIVRLGQQFAVSNSGAYGGMAINCWTSGGGCGLLDLNNSNSNTLGNYAVKTNGQFMGSIVFRGSDGTTFTNGAVIQGIVNGTPSAGIMPTDLQFFTSSSTTQNVERMRITNAGNVGIGTSVPTSTLHVVDARTTNNSSGLNLRKTGIVVGTSYGLEVITTGAGTTNVGAYLSASGATNNYALVVPSGGGRVGIGTETPETKLNISGTTSTSVITMSVTGQAAVVDSVEQSILFRTADPTVAAQHKIGAIKTIGTDAFGKFFRLGLFTASGLETEEERLSILNNGNVGIGVTAPTAVLHLKAGTATAGTAPLKFTSGTLLTAPVAGTVEFLTDAYYGTITTGAARKTFAFLESPIFITPNLGTPSAGVMTNVTGIATGLTAGNLSNGLGGQVLYQSAVNTTARLANGTAGQVLTSAGTTLAPTWTTPTTVSSGTYTPTLTNTTNVTSSTAYVCTYLRVGNTVTVSGRFDIQPTTTALNTLMGLSLPVASNFTTADQAGGCGIAPGGSSQGAAILSDATNDRASVQFKAVGTVALIAINFTFTYQVL